MMSRFVSYAVALWVLIAVVPAAAQPVDPRTCAHGTLECNQARSAQAEGDAAYAEETRQWQAQRRALLATPPLPAERNTLLGTWRLGDDQRSSTGELGRETDSEGLGGILTVLSSMRLDKIGCEAAFSGGLTLGPSTYSRGDVAGAVGGPIGYRSARSGAKSAIAAIPGDGGMMIFEVANPNQIVSEDGCVLVRGGASATNAASNAATAPGMLAVGPDAGGYLCPDGRQLYVESCYDELPDARCGIINVHLPKRGRYQVTSSDVRSTIMSSVAACKVYPVDFGDDGTASLVLPKSVAPAQNPTAP